jgi:succinoglycan biosynthesis transport protein ExoP
MNAILGMDEAAAEQSFLAEVSAKLWRRKLLIGGLTIAVFSALAIGIQFLPKTYEASSSVSVEQTPKAVATGNVIQDMPFDDETIGTEMALLKSRELLTEAMRRTNLLRNPEFNPHLTPSLLARLDALSNGRLSRWMPHVNQWLPSDEPLDATAAERQVADTLRTLQRRVQFTPQPRSRVIDITLASSNNELAANIVNTIANLYIADHLTYREDMNKAAHDFVEQRVQELKNSATSAADAVVKFRVAHGLTVTSSRDNSTIIQEQATTVNTQLQEAKNRLATAQAQYDGDRKADPEALAASLGSQTISRLREQEAQALADRARFSATYGDNSPVVAPYNIRVASIRAQIHAEAVRVVQSLPNQIRSAQEATTALTQRLNDLKSQLADLDGARAELALLEVESAAQNNIYREFLERSKQTDTAVLFPATPVRVISRAVAPIRPAFPDNKLMIPAAGILSFVLSAGFAMLLERRKGLVSTGDVETMLGIPALGMLPVRSSKTEEMYQDVIEDVLSRLLYDHGASSVLVTSALPNEGKSTTAQGLVQAAINRGLNALLIEADMRSSYGRARVANGTLGLGEVLRGEIKAGDAVRRPSNELTVLPAGQARGNATRLLSNPRMQQAIEALSNEYDFIVVDAPPVLVGGDAWSLSRHVDRTVLIARWEHTEPQQVGLAIKQLVMPRNSDPRQGLQAGTNLAGLVLNMVDPSRCVKLGNADSIRFSAAMFKYYRR